MGGLQGESSGGPTWGECRDQRLGFGMEGADSEYHSVPLQGHLAHNNNPPPRTLQ